VIGLLGWYLVVVDS